MKTVFFLKNRAQQKWEFRDKMCERVRKGKNLPSSLQPRKKVVDVVEKS